MPPFGQILAYGAAVVKLGIVANHVDLLETAKPAAEVVEVSQEELGVSARARRRQQQPPGSPVQRPGQVPLWNAVNTPAERPVQLVRRLLSTPVCWHLLGLCEPLAQ